MGSLLQAVIPAAVGLLLYQGGLTRTSRLRSTIRANMDMLEKLPADHPSRAALTAHIEELVDTLVRRQRGRFQPSTLGPWFGVNVTLAVMMALAISFSALAASGVWEADEPTRNEQWQNTIAYGVFAVAFAFFAVKTWRRQQREQPQPGQA
jgi:hypothetical protein